MMGTILLVAAVKSWALGAFLVILGVLGALFLLLTEDNWKAHSEIWELLLTLCGLMVVVPFLMLLPEEVRRSLDFEYMLEALALVVVAAIWLGMHSGLPWLRRLLRKHPRPQRHGRRGKMGRH